MPFSTIRTVSDHRQGWREEQAFPAPFPSPLGMCPFFPFPLRLGAGAQCPPGPLGGGRQKARSWNVLEGFMQSWP